MHDVMYHNVELYAVAINISPAVVSSTTSFLRGTVKGGQFLLLPRLYTKCTKSSSSIKSCMKLYTCRPKVGLDCTPKCTTLLLSLGLLTYFLLVLSLGLFSNCTETVQSLYYFFNVGTNRNACTSLYEGIRTNFKDTHRFFFVGVQSEE